MSKQITILYLDPEPRNLQAFSAWFRRKEAYACHTCSKEEEALELLKRYPVQIFIADQPAAGSLGMEFLVRIPAGSQPRVKIIWTAHRELSLLEKAVNEGVIHAYFSKPVDFEELERRITTFCSRLSVDSTKDMNDTR